MKQLVLAFALVMGLSAPALASSLELSLNDDSVQLQLNQPLMGDGYGSTEAVARLLYNDEHETLLGAAGVNVLGQTGTLPGMTFGIGAHLYGADADDADVLAVGLGGVLRYLPPALGGVDVAGQFYYAPNIISFADSDRLIDSAVSVGYQLMPRARVFVGYRNLRVDFKSSDFETIDSGLVVGARVSF